MTPQIVGLDAGIHNRNLDGAKGRIVKSGVWKRQRIILLLPTSMMIPAKVALSHWNLIFPPNQGVVRLLCMGMEVGEAYSQAIQNVVAIPQLAEFEYILTIEHDNIPPPDGVLKLIERLENHPEFACIGGLYWTKGEGGVPQIWGDPKDPAPNYRPQPPRAGELVECWGCGMGFNLWRLSMFKDDRLRKPWFKTMAGIGGVGTQDLYFWSDARKYGYRCGVDCAVLVGHYDHETDVTW